MARDLSGAASSELHFARIWDCLTAHTERLAPGVREGDLILYNDALLPDMYDLNFVKALRAAPEAVKQAARRAVDGARERGVGMAKVTLPEGSDLAMLEDVLAGGEVVRLGLFACGDLSSLSFASRSADVRLVADTQGIAGRLAVELASYDSPKANADFLRRKSERYAPEYLGKDGIDAYVCHDESGAPVGKADLFIHDGTAMLEDFDVVPARRRQGYGTAVLRKMVDDAIARGANLAFLQTDLNDTAQGMYRKLGFAYIGEYAEIWFDLGQASEEPGLL